MTLFTDLSHALVRHRTNRAFWISGTFHTYADLADALSRIRVRIKEQVGANEKIIGLLANDDLETYASILALWFEGKAYVPIAPGSPEDRNQRVIKSAGFAHLLSSTATTLQLVDGMLIRTDGLPPAIEDLSVATSTDEAMAYMLFTSGTTGEPKGVPISHGNLAGFVDAFEKLGIPIGPQDRCLQMFELTFDLSVMSYLMPLLHGACVYPVPNDEIKYASIAEILEDHELTVALMVPSIINYLRPYFSEINAPALKHGLFCGEALLEDVAVEWSRCVPNARIMNVYGPTEHTIFCTHYTLSRTGPNKALHGVLSIGSPMAGSTIVVADEAGRILGNDASGELCLAGPQLTSGYWNNEERTAAAFFTADHDGVPVRFYRTGDHCRIDADGDILYMGRLDQQTKVQGYRVELPEIEHHARAFLESLNAVAVGVTNQLGNTEIALLVESEKEIGTRDLIAHLRLKLPPYMVPSIVRCVPTFPLNANGKTDRKALREEVMQSAV